jgi:hypothetical protein
MRIMEFWRRRRRRRRRRKTMHPQDTDATRRTMNSDFVTF